MVGQETQPQEFNKIGSGAATNLQQPEVAKLCPAKPNQQGCNRALPFLVGEHNRWIQQAVPLTVLAAPSRIACRDGNCFV